MYLKDLRKKQFREWSKEDKKHTTTYNNMSLLSLHFNQYSLYIGTDQKEAAIENPSLGNTVYILQIDNREVRSLSEHEKDIKEFLDTKQKAEKTTMVINRSKIVEVIHNEDNRATVY